MRQRDFLKAISLLNDENRRKIVEYLYNSKPSLDLELAKATDLSFDAVSSTTTELREAGVIEAIQRSIGTFYALTSLGREIVAQFKAFLK